MMKFNKYKLIEPKNYKIVFLGESGIGKSSIIYHCKNGCPSNINGSTIGAIFYTDGYDKELTNNNKTEKIRLHIWDTSGQERFRTIVSLYYRNADVCIVACDLTSIESINSIDEWIEIFKGKTNNDETKVLLLGNKLDLIEENDKKYKLNLLNKKGELHQCPVLAVSALTGINIGRIYPIIFDLIENQEPCENKEKLKFDQAQPSNLPNNKWWWNSWCNLL